MSPPPLQPMDLGDILDGAFRLYRRRLGRFLTIALVAYVPYAVIAALLQTAIQRYMIDSVGDSPVFELEVVGPSTAMHLANGSPPQMLIQGVLLGQAGSEPIDALETMGIAFVTAAGLILAWFVAWALCTAALTYNISASLLGHDLSAVESYRQMSRRFMPFLGAVLITSLAIGIGMGMCVVPGWLLKALFIAVIPIVLLENGKVFASIGRAVNLASPRFLPALGLVVLIAVFSGIQEQAFAMAVMWGFTYLNTILPFDVTFVQFLLAHSFELLLLPIQTVPVVLFYYDLRVRREGLDLQLLARQAGMDLSE